jgi:hypothetical protein
MDLKVVTEMKENDWVEIESEGGAKPRGNLPAASVVEPRS